MRLIPLVLFLLLGVENSFSHPGVGIVMDSKGNVYYTDLKQVWKISTKGDKSIVVHSVHTHELFIDQHDNLWGEHLWYNGEAVDTWGHYVWRLSLSPGGRLEKIIPDANGFLTNFSFVHDKLGNMYWADRETTCQKVIRKNKDGSKTTLGNQCMENIRWMTVTDDGIIYLIDLYNLKRVDTQGNVTTIALRLQERNLSQFFVNDVHSIMGISVDHHQNIYASIYSAREVKKITPSGAVSVITQTSIPWSPTGTLVAPNGDLWILEYSVTNAVRVEKITVEGQRIIY
jgi:hypothetical protein